MELTRNQRIQAQVNALKDLLNKKPQAPKNEDELCPFLEADHEEQNPFYPYNNQFHKETTEQKMKELEEQKKLQLNSKDEVKKHLEKHKRIAKKYPNGNE